MTTITIDGRRVEASGTLLDCCDAAGAAVPAFCADRRVGSEGHCRMCMVEVDGRFQAACVTRPQAGMTVVTDSPRLLAYRKDLGELVLTTARPKGAVGEKLAALGCTGDTYRALPLQHLADETHPYLRFDLDACILCHLCVRVCSEVQGQFVYSVAGRGAEARLTWGDGPFKDSTDCVSCGACAAICPTEAITDRDRAANKTADNTQAANDTVRTTCSYCGVGCQLDVHVRREPSDTGLHDVAWIDGAPSDVNREHTCVKGRYAHSFARHPDRLTRPLLRKQGRLEPVSWGEALANIAGEVTRLRGSLALLSSSRCTNEENYLAQKWFRGGLDTNHVDCCARVCHAPSAAGMRHSLGTGAATNSLADLEKADALLVAGSNTTASHPVTGARIKQAVLRGARLIVIDPRTTELASLADVHLQLRPGTNVPLLNSIAAVIVAEGLVDAAFLAARVLGFATYENFILSYLPEQTEAITGVPANLVRKAARLYAGALRPMQVHGLGMTEHFQGSEGVMLLCNLALLVGAVGHEGVGVNPLRGQNNVQGAADMGCQPDLTTGYQRPDDPGVRQLFQSVWGRPLPTEPGLTLPRMYDQARAGTLKGMFILGEDVVQTDPDAHNVVEALSKLELLVVQEIFLSKTAELAHVVLPGASFLEKDGTFTNGERRIQRVRKAIEPPGEARADWEILCALMGACGWPQSYDHPSAIFDEIAKVNPSFHGASYALLDAEGIQWPIRDGQSTPILHRERFPLPSGKAKLAEVPFLPSPTLSEITTGDRKLLLTTGRTLEHYNSGSMTRRTPNLELYEHETLEIHPDDANERAIVDGAVVDITSRFGRARAVAKRTTAVARGTAFMTFHFPESGANFVTTDVVDRIADCPEYKLVPVEVAPATGIPLPDAVLAHEPATKT